MLFVEELTKQYGDVPALRGVTLRFGAGFTAVTGRSGSGKSTLLKAAGLMIPAEGRIWFRGKEVSGLSEREKDGLRNREIGFVFQDYSLEPAYTVRENVELPLLLAGVKRRERRARADECLAFVGLEHKADKRAGQLSGGEQQRVAVARAVANRPGILLADEPCGNLDRENGKNLIGLFKRLAAEGVCVVMVTHNAEDAAEADRIVTLSDGQVLSDTAATGKAVQGAAAEGRFPAEPEEGGRDG